MPIAHPLVTTLKSLHGNARGAVLTEPLWGIPYNLYAPYVSIYMLALGLTDAQIGLLASISLALQIFWTLLSGALTDKLGRKRTTLIFDTQGESYVHANRSQRRMEPVLGGRPARDQPVSAGGP